MGTTMLACALVAFAAQPSLPELLRQFETNSVFWRQFEIAVKIADAHDRSVLPRLEPWLNHGDRQLRGNAAYIFARLGDPRGFDIIVAILNDRSNRPFGSQSLGGRNLPLQVRQDRYYAAHLLGDLGDPRAIPILVGQLKDPDTQPIVPWSLARIGTPAAIPPLLATLKSPDASMRVLAIYALVDLKAKEAIPHLRGLLKDEARASFGGLEKVSDTARRAIEKLQ